MDSIGVDIGTSIVKAVRFNEALEVQDQASGIVPVNRPDAVSSEQDMDAVLTGVLDVVAAVAPTDGVVAQVALTAQGDGCWLVDDQARPTGPAILWSDARASDLVDGWEADGILQRAFEITGSYGNAGLPAAILAWLKTHDLQRLERSVAALTCGSWIYLGLTGRTVLDVSEACNPWLDASTLDYSQELLDAYDLADVRRLLPKVVDGADRVGELHSAVAKRAGLAEGTPVVLAPYDVISASIGVGAVAPGSGFAVLGTTLCIAAPSENPGLDRDPAGMALATGSGRWLLAYATLAGTEVLEWWARTLGQGSAAELAQMASGSTSDHVPLFLPYLSPAGERAPIRDASARGAMVGLDFTHTPADVARGAMEGLTMAVRDCLTASQQDVDVLRITGGGSRSDYWTQMIADALHRPVQRTTGEQTGALGAVLSGRVSLGIESDLADTVARHIEVERTFEPSEAGQVHMDQVFDRFMSARKHMVHRA